MAKGWCGYHYNTARNHGDPLFLDRRVGASCSEEGCLREAGRNGRCKPHYLKHRRKAKTRVRRRECSIEGCQEPHASKSYCEDHYYRFRKYGDPLHPVSCRKGTGHINTEGYRLITRKKKPVFEHRWVMSQHLGRDLLPEENVHHLNGQRADNRLENLELWSSHQPPGQRVEDKVRWAREIISLYGNLY